MSKHNPPNQSLNNRIEEMLSNVGELPSGIYAEEFRKLWEKAVTNERLRAKEAIHQLIQDEVIRELESLNPPKAFEDFARLAGGSTCAICGFDHIKFRKHINDRISALREGKE